MKTIIAISMIGFAWLGLIGLGSIVGELSKENAFLIRQECTWEKYEMPFAKREKVVFVPLAECSLTK